MQSLTWYRNRLMSMSAGEAAWRARTAVRTVVDRGLCAWRGRHPAIRQIAAPGDRRGEGLGSGRGKLFGGALASPVLTAEHYPDDWRQALIQRADAVLEHRFCLLGDEPLDFGQEINWNYEHRAGKPTPMRFAPSIDYRDFDETGDCKWVWELNRHHHLVVLGRAFRVTGDRRYALEVSAQLESWIRQCPFGRGMNWRSPLELAIRLINWVWALELIRPANAVSAETADRILRAAYRHLWEIDRNYARYSSANNHLIGEAAGVFIGSRYFDSLRGASRWRARSREILLREIVRQTHADGGNRELATGYHQFVVQFFLAAGLCARNASEDFSRDYWARIEQMLAFSAAFGEAGGTIPAFGDCDDGYVLDLGGPRGDYRGLLAVGAVLFDRPDFKRLAAGVREPVFWFCGPAGLDRLDRLEDASPQTLESRAFPDSGYYLLQAGRAGGDSISVAFDCGELGFGSTAAHGHADALSFTLRVNGADILVDPGTHDYFTYPDWRTYFRSTRAHNTIEIDGRDQSEMSGPFLWGRRAHGRCDEWTVSEDAVTVSGVHDGYESLADPVTHRREIALDRARHEVRLRDELIGEGRHTVAQHFHFSEACVVERVDENRFRASCPEAVVELILDTRLACQMFRGNTSPIIGWVSRKYHQKSPCTTLVGKAEIDGTTHLETVISVCPVRKRRPVVSCTSAG